MPELDGIRGLAIVLVLIGHLFNHVLPEGGGFGVSLFFVLSGYLITGILMREIERDGSIHIGRFYLRRVRRLIPPLVVFLVAFAVWAAIAGWTPERILHSTLPVLFYSANWSGAVGWGVGHHMDHTWSLAVEEQFYIGWPLLLGIFAAWRRAWLVALLLAAAVIALRNAAVHLANIPADPIYTLLRYDEILLGCVLALARVRFPAWAGVLALAALLPLAAMHEVRVSLHYFGYVVIAVLMAVLVGSAASLRGLLSVAPLRYFGRISYSLYLWHFPIWVITQNPWLTLVLSIGVADLSWRFLERHIMSGRYLPWLSRGESPVAPAGATSPR
jgi:peptidoglycan/LPS O-acetylase OafA/YrhL